MLCGLAAGCVPIPKQSVVRYGVQGRLMDAATGAPIARSHATLTVDGQEFDRKTNRRGEFKVSPDLHHFWTWLGGPMWMNATRATVDIAFDEYRPYHKTFVVRTESLDVPVPPDQDRLSGNYITIGDIEMKKRQPDGAANGRQPFRSVTNPTSSAAASCAWRIRN